MNAIGTNLKDAYILTTQIYEDNRGSFKESFNLREVQKIIGNYEFVQDCHSTSVKNVVNMVDEDFDLVIRMRTDVEFPERVPLEECKGDGLSMMNGAMQAGAGREYCDWFYCGPVNRVQQFDPLKVYDEFYKDGIRHMHELVRQTLASLQIPHRVLDLKAWMTDRSKVK